MRQSFFIFILNQLFPLRCLGCKVSGFKICSDCFQKIKQEPLWLKLEGVKVWSAIHYKQALISKVMQAWKYKGDKKLGDMFLLAVKYPNVQADLIVPVPLHKRRWVERGFNQAEQVGAAVSICTGLKISNDLQRGRYTKQQAGLDGEARRKNLKEAFIWKGPSLHGRTILLVDDVVTTGSTLSACVEVLKEAGAKEVLGICLFRGGK